MREYQIEYTPRADRDLSKLPPDIANKIVNALHGIRIDPYQHVKKMKASNPKHPVYSFGVMREVRALLSIHNDVLIIHVLEVEHRKHAYRDF